MTQEAVTKRLQHTLNRNHTKLAQDLMINRASSGNEQVRENMTLSQLSRGVDLQLFSD
jgi:hypothetical protein